MLEMTPEELCAKYRAVRLNIPALSGLEEVEWSSLQHAYGKASDFPCLLKAALSEVQSEREYALSLLYGTIWHQGTIYEATAYAVPFIAGLIQSAAVSNQVDFAMLLAAIAEGRGAFEYGFRDAEDKERWRTIFAKEGIDLEDRIAEGRKWGQATRDAVRTHVHLLYPFLTFPDKEVRTSIAQALACCPELAAETLPLLEHAIGVEEDQETKDQLEEAVGKLRSSLKG